MLTLFAVLIFDRQFNGGSAAELACFLTSNTKKSVVMGTFEDFPKKRLSESIFTLNEKYGRDENSACAKLFGLVPEKELESITPISLKALPSWFPRRGDYFVRVWYKEHPNLRPKSLRNESGKVTCSFTEPIRCNVSDLNSWRWSKPLDCHWLTERYNFVASISEVPEKDFLRAVASACAAVFSETSTGFYIKPNPKRIIEQWAARYDEAATKSTNPGVIAFARLKAESVRSFSPKALEKLLYKERQAVGIDFFPGSAHFDTALKVIDCAFNYPLGSTDDERRRYLARQKESLKDADYDKPIKLVFSSELDVDLFIPRKGKEGAYIIFSQ